MAIKFPETLPGEDLLNSWYPIIFAICIGVLATIRQFLKGGECRSPVLMKGKTVIVTGGNGAVGIEAAKDLAQRGARVILACRDEDRAKESINILTSNVKNDLKASSFVIMKLDLDSFESVKSFAIEFMKKESRLDVLVNNAGIMCHPKGKTSDGNEIHLQVNYLSHFLLIHCLKDRIESGSPCRIINVTCSAYQLGELNTEDLNSENKECLPGELYAISKLCVCLSTRSWSSYFSESKVTINVVNPGVVNSNCLKHMPFKKSTLMKIAFGPLFWFITKTGKDGAQSIIQCAVGTEEEGVSGKIYSDCHLTQYAEKALDDELKSKLWSTTQTLLNVEL